MIFHVSIPLRIELAGGLYHVTARGDRREAIYRDDQDRLDWPTLLGEVCRRFNWRCHAYCEMTNHYHFVVETPDANLSKGMRQLNGVYTQTTNRRHGAGRARPDSVRPLPAIACYALETTCIGRVGKAR
ncbi:transposase [Thiorhodovibrio frisius]|uniref:Transposase n=1 Tax=Thiorhodovibrio frisius TaxID=631362 RepID=H8YZ63_9GAMM|nr:transposase [Thiorhodovibrio frisius]WPL24279.1 Transposase [Thiorhodovibrio frisius]